MRIEECLKLHYIERGGEQNATFALGFSGIKGAGKGQVGARKEGGRCLGREPLHSAILRGAGGGTKRGEREKSGREKEGRERKNKGWRRSDWFTQK